MKLDSIPSFQGLLIALSIKGLQRLREDTAFIAYVKDRISLITDC